MIFVYYQEEIWYKLLTRRLDIYTQCNKWIYEDLIYIRRNIL